MLFKIKYRLWDLPVALALLISAQAPAYAEATVTPAPEAMQQIIKSALATHPRLIAAQAELDASQAQYAAASRAIYNPELELDTEKTNIRTSTIGLSQTIDWGDQQGAKTSIASQKLIAAQAAFQLQRQQLIRDLLNALINFKNKSRLAELSNRRLKLMKDFYLLAKKKHSVGDLNQVELDLAQLAYSESVLKNAQAMSEQVEAEQAYYALYGKSSTAGSVLNADFSYSFQRASLPASLETFLLGLPQMKVVRANVEASKSTIALRQGESSADPTIAIRGGKEDSESLVGVTLSIPLNIRNNFSAEIDVARKEYLSAEQLAQQAYLNLQGSLHSRYRHYQLTQSAWQSWQSGGQVSMNRQLKLLKRLWRTGDLSTTDYLVQIKQNLDTHSAGIELHTTLWASWLAWLDVTAQIESWLKIELDKRNSK